MRSSTSSSNMASPTTASCRRGRPTVRDALPGTPADHYLTRAETNEFLIGLYDRWLEHGDRKIRIRELTGIEAGIRRKTPAFCKLAGGCLGQYFLVEPGEVAHCDLFIGDESYTLGNVLDDEFAEIRESANMHALVRRREAELSQTRSAGVRGLSRLVPARAIRRGATRSRLHARLLRIANVDRACALTCQRALGRRSISAGDGGGRGAWPSHTCALSP